MPDDRSARLDLPYLMPSQAQKHVTHNEALRALDILVQMVVESFVATSPPDTPAEGQIYATGAGTTGAWAGQDGKIAAFVDGGWHFIAPQEGWIAVARATGTIRVWQGGLWRLPAAGTPDLDNLDGVGVNTAADGINRLAVAAPATLFTHEGGGHQIKINKAGVPETASLLFQSDWSGRAEIGLAGEDALSFKVSQDGATWREALRVTPATGRVGVGGVTPARKLHVAQAMRLEPGAEPANGAAGDLYFDAGTMTLRAHDGTTWHDLF